MNESKAGFMSITPSIDFDTSSRRDAKYRDAHIYGHTDMFVCPLAASHISTRTHHRRWDSERELFHDDIVHVQASAYAHWTDFL